MLVFRKRRQRTWVAWLALAALWLTVGVPVISRSLPQGMASVELGAWCTGHGLAEPPRQAPADPAAPIGKCGYCSLFCHSPLIAGDVGLSLALSSPGTQPPLAAAVPEAPVLHQADLRSRGPPPLA